MSRRQAVPHVRFIFAGYSGEYAVGSGYVLVSLRAYASACALLPVGNTVAPFCQFAHLLRQRRHAGVGNVP